MSAGDVQDRYCSEKKLGRDGPFVSQLVRLRTDGQATQMLLRRLAPEVKCEESAARAFLELCEDLSAVNAPNLLRIFECGVDREGLYLVTECPRHVALMSLLGRITFPPLQAAMVVEQAARGLTAAGVGIIHGTLMPEHLWITPAGIIKIKDFGLYLLFQNLGQCFKRETLSYWLDPEIIAGLKPDERADYYSLGRILRELLRIGSTQKDTAGVTAAVAYHEEPPEQVPDRLRSILARCLHADRTMRFGQSTDLVSALTTFLQEEGVTDTIDGLKSFLRQRAKGSGSLDRFEQLGAFVQQPDQHAALLDPSAFWNAKHEENPVEEDSAVAQELSNPQAEGLLKLSQRDHTRPRQTEPPMMVADLNTPSEAVSEPRKKFSMLMVPDWLKVVGGILLATTIGGLLGWYLIGQWTVEESGGRNLSVEKIQNTDVANEHGPKEVTAVIDSGTKPSGESPATPEVSDKKNEIPTSCRERV
jgi:Serine/threonine protein kinase